MKYIGMTYDDIEDEHQHILRSAIRLYLKGTPPKMPLIQVQVNIMDVEAKIAKLKKELNDATGHMPTPLLDNPASGSRPTV
jgi:hypothetical protein